MFFQLLKQMQQPMGLNKIKNRTKYGHDYSLAFGFGKNLHMYDPNRIGASSDFVYVFKTLETTCPQYENVTYDKLIGVPKSI